MLKLSTNTNLGGNNEHSVLVVHTCSFISFFFVVHV